MKKRFLRIMMGVTLSVAALSPAIMNEMPTDKLDVATTTYDYKWWSINTIRNQLKTTYQSKSTSYSTYITVDTFKNTKSYPVSHEFTDETTETSSVSLGTKVTVKAIETEAGKSVSYSKTKSYKTSASVPAKDTMVLKLRTKTEALKYSSKVQRQDNYIWFTPSKGFYTTWENIGSPTTASSTQTAKSPDWIVK